MEDFREDPLARLAKEVLEYASPSFVLKDDLRLLVAVNRVGAPEAVILYCARILDTLTGDALRRVGQTPSVNIFSNLQVLEQLNRIGSVARYWAHAVRRLGNVVRHIHRRIDPDEAVLSSLFTEGCLEWFFCDFSHGHRLKGLTRDAGPLGLVGGHEFRAHMTSLKKLHAADAVPHEHLNPAAVESDPRFFSTPVLAAILGEIRLSRNELEHAFRVLDAGLAKFPNDVRLRQLMGLHWSRKLEFEKALTWLEPLFDRSDADDETVGITAGVYKRMWEADRTNQHALEKSHRAYRDAWKNSGKKNTYLGINCAMTSLCRGRVEDARRQAKEVEEVLNARVAAAPPGPGDPCLTLSFWDQVTLAEARALQGDLIDAQRNYDSAFAAYADRHGDIEVSRRQMSEILRMMDLPNALE
jgi:tetratricopeptide (TPR) repeat protein